MPTPSTLAPASVAGQPEPAADKPAGRPSARLAAQAPAAAAGGARRPGSTARHEKAATGRHDKPATARYGKPVTARHQRSSGGFGRYVVFGLIALVVIGACAYGPVTRSIALGKLDAAKGEEALLAADAYVKLVDGSKSRLNMLVRENHGPVEAQVHVAKDAKLFSALVMICERPLSDPPPPADGKPVAAPPSNPSLALVTQDQRILALDAATAIYQPESMASEVLPDDLAKWAKEGGYKTELSLAAMRLIAAARPKYAMETLLAIATAAGQDSQRTEAAIDAIAANTDSDNLGYSINLLQSRVSDIAVARTKLTDNITKLSSPNHLGSLVALLSSPKDEVRAIAIEAMGGPHMQLGDSPADYHKREELGKSITPKLDEKTPPVELAATLKAVKGLRLIGARDAVLALVPKLATLHLEGIGASFMSDLLGKAMISTLQPADAGKDAKGAEAAAEAVKLATEARVQSEDLITKLIAALDVDASRTVAAGALMLIRDPSFLSLRAGLDKLQAHGENPDCFTALTVLVDKTYNRPDVLKANGKELEKWKDFLAADRPHFDRVKEIIEWMATHRNNLQIGDGRHRAELGEAKDYIAKAQEELDAWLMDPTFVSPLGMTKSQITSLVKDLKMKGKDVRAAFAGSTE